MRRQVVFWIVLFVLTLGMYQRLDRGQTFPMIRMVATLPTMFSEANRFHSSF